MGNVITWGWLEERASGVWVLGPGVAWMEGVLTRGTSWLSSVEFFGFFDVSGGKAYLSS